MASNYVSEGRVVQHTAASDISSGDVVAMGGTLGVALGDIATGETGSVAVQGVFRVPKVPAAVIAQGDRVMWDSSAGAFDDDNATPATGDVTGPGCMAAASAGNGETTVDVLFIGAPGTVA